MNVRFFIVPCMHLQWEISVGLRQLWAANLATAVVACVVVAASSAINMRLGVWIYRKWYAVPPQYPQNTDVQLRNDEAFCTELQGELKTAMFGMCTNNPTVRGKPPLQIPRRLDLRACLLSLLVSRSQRCWPWPCQDSFFEPDFVSSARSQLYFVMLAGCQVIGVHDGLAWVGRHTSGWGSTRGPCALKQKYHLPSRC